MGFATQFFADGTIEPAGYRQIFPTTVKDIQVGNARTAIIQAMVQNIRWTDDGQIPTSTFGTVLHAGESLWYTGDLTKFRFIEAASGAEVNISAYK